ncbi:deleted in malignant brain tumors 1 isoform X1 [Paramuricea clavata]|uniref:Deleted in malignant brain tumors 1 isoform X1 n=1 Tax=Paramuricea clavata TaxID=317549 RepID=A0A7D9L0Y3_PARCT|nr:deleted in malignant brain tumors 1 isoform X1 [Paramuricea clavata]
MKKKNPDIDGPKSNKWFCSFKNPYGWKESCAIRIRSGTDDDTHIGQVEVNVEKSEIWKKIFSSNWTMNEANVVCKEAGHGKALEFINEKHYPRRKSLDDTIFPADVSNEEQYSVSWIGNCSGSEYSILRCGELNPTHITTAVPGVGVRCQIPGKKHYIVYL